MSIQSVSPCIICEGTAAKAIQLYESALGAKVESISHYGDAPAGHEAQAVHKDLVMHSSLRVGQTTIMVMDTTPERGLVKGANMQIFLEFTGAGEMIKAVDALSAGGKITLPINDTFWGSKFAMLIDAYGAHWMLSAPFKHS